MFGFKKKKPIDIYRYNKQTEVPAVKSSICTGEKTAGFLEVNTGKYRDIMLVESDADIEVFKSACGVDEVKEIY
ncbi:MAG: aspartate dehydrogenase [Saccharofermentans sp.]|nr:aspartate dehydrogenase [Saccharofermentans sp.]